MKGQFHMNNTKKENVILQIKYPIITSYTSDAHMLAILNNYPSTNEWVFNQYINLWGEEPVCNNNSLVLRFNSWLIRRVCPYFNINTLYTNNFNSDIIEFIISEIDSSYYLYILYDQYYIPNSEAYMKRHFEHEMLIYGYDTKEKIFYIADFYKNSKYTFTVAPFDCVENAIKGTLKSEQFSCDEIEFCNTNYKFSNYLLYNSLNNFLYSKNTVAENENVILENAELEEIQKGRYTFGIKNYSLLIQSLSKLLHEKIDFYDIRPLYVIFDHKVMMCERLKYLANMGIIDFNDSIIDKYLNIKKICVTNCNLFIKFSLTKDYNLINKIINNINILESLETEAITYLIEKVSKKL